MSSSVQNSLAAATAAALAFQNDQQLRKHVLTVTLVTAAVIYSVVTQAWMKKQSARMDTGVVLPDLLQTALPDLHRLHLIVDVVIVAIVAALVLSSFAMEGLYGGVRLLADFMRVAAALYFVKVLTRSVTILPDSSMTCTDKHGPDGSLFGSCNDLIFSSHMALAVLCAYFFVNRIVTVANTTVVLAASAVLAVYGMLIIATRNHYSIDVLVSIFVVDVCYRYLG
jgi:hypothetical protein